MSGTHGVDLLLEVSSHFRLVNKKSLWNDHREIIHPDKLLDKSSDQSEMSINKPISGRRTFEE